MLILDTNVFSALMRSEPDAAVVAWMDRQPRSSLWTTAVTLLEIRFGLEIMPAEKKRNRLIAVSDRMLHELIESRIRPFDAAAAQYSAELMAGRQKAGRPVELRDTMIAGIVLASRATLVTRNTKHFADLSVSLIDPWTVR
jgi:hypothetical protein